MLNNDKGASTRQVAMPGVLRGTGFSGVSWAAVFAGAVAAAALSVILLMLGLGLGFSAISPWASDGMGATAITISAAIWLIIMQVLASGLGGYLAGRLRGVWDDVHGDEIYFRDTAHGMLSWAVATLVLTGILGSALSGMVGAGGKAAGSAVSGLAPAAQSAVTGIAGDDGGSSLDYFVDSLFRTDQPSADTQDMDRRQKEVAAILTRSLQSGELSQDDRAYLASLVSQRTGLDQAAAEERIDSLYAQAQQTAQDLEQKAKEVADSARKAAAATALWSFIALLCGAFAASLAALWGGRRRDMAVMVADSTLI